MENNTLILIGMHRSGTSLTAQCLSLSGVNMGDVQLQPDFSNSDGHFDDQEFLYLHKDILRQNGLQDNGLFLKHPPRLNDYFKKRLQNMVGFKNSLRPQWGFKEPRTCLFIGHYLEVLPEAKLLVVYRPFEEVVGSLLRRDAERYVLLNKTSGRLGRLRLAWKGSKHIKSMISKHLPWYSKAWLQYNQNILNTLHQLAPSQYVISPVKDLQKNESQLFQQFLDWGFRLEHVPISSFYAKEKMNKKSEHLDRIDIAYAAEDLEMAQTIEQGFLKLNAL